MKIMSVNDEAFHAYGRIVTGADFSELLQVLNDTTKAPSDAVIYVASDKTLEQVNTYSFLTENCFGGMPIQIGYCNGTSTKLNCLEYHKNSEVIVAGTDLILLLGKLQDAVSGSYDTDKVEAFLCKKGCAVEIYMTTLHYAPCSAKNGESFRAIITLPKDTNVGRPEIEIKNEEDERLFARNKWIFAHKESPEASEGAYIGLTGINIDIKDSI